MNNETKNLKFEKTDNNFSLKIVNVTKMYYIYTKLIWITGVFLLSGS